MLGKLFKHDMRALAKSLAWVQLGVIGLSVLATMVTAIEIRIGRASYESAMSNPALFAVFSMMQILTVLGIGASFLLVLFFICRHFYRNLFCDEGYLTHTLPVSPASLLWSKVLAGFVWELISFFVVLLSVLFFLTCGTSPDTLFNPEPYRVIGEILSLEFPQEAWRLVAPFVLYALFAVLSALLQLYLALTIGCAIGRRHRVAIAIGFYIVIAFVIGIVNAVFSIPVLIANVFSFSLYPQAAAMETALVNSFSGALWWQTAIYAAFATVFFLTAEYLMRKKLNLQ